MAGNLPLNFAPVDLGGVILCAPSGFRPGAHAKSLEIVTTIEDDARRISGDSGRLEQVVWNLLSNAVKFSDKAASIEVSAKRVGTSVEIAVADSGSGIAPELLPHVFERFRQASTASTRSHGGLGLGLAIVKNLVELHGGNVEVTSPGLGEGSVFRVRLPAAASTDRHDSGRLSAAEISALPSLLGLRILVVDDEADARDLMAELLRAHGAVVQTADSASAALAIIDDEAPDVLVSDIGMPGEDGYSLIRHVRRSGRLPSDLPAAAVTAFARVEDRTSALLAGFQAHVAKPVDPSELVIVVANLAGRSLTKD
jgi:CheY-like chemotaxis protein